MARIIPDPRRVASAWRARWAWNRAAWRVRVGDLVTVEYATDGYQWWASGATTEVSGTPFLGSLHLVPFTRATWPAEGRYTLHRDRDDQFPMWDAHGLPRPTETIPRLYRAGGLHEVQVWWSGDNGHDGRTDHCVRGTLLDIDDVYGEVFVGRDTDTGTTVPLDLIIHVTVHGEIPAEVIA